MEEGGFVGGQGGGVEIIGGWRAAQVGVGGGEC